MEHRLAGRDRRPPGEEHWHGATPEDFMEHLAMRWLPAVKAGLPDGCSTPAVRVGDHVQVPGVGPVRADGSLVTGEVRRDREPDRRGRPITASTPVRLTGS